jgi:hypothetical protein
MAEDEIVEEDELYEVEKSKRKPSYSSQRIKEMIEKVDKKISEVKEKIEKDKDVIPYNDYWEDFLYQNEGRYGKELDDLEKRKAELEKQLIEKEEEEEAIIDTEPFEDDDFDDSEFKF